MREKEFAILVSDKKYRDYDPQEELKQLTKTAGAEVAECIRFDFLLTYSKFLYWKRPGRKIKGLMQREKCEPDNI